MPPRPLATARLNSSKESLRALGGRDRIAHGLSRARNRTGDRKLEKNAEGRGRSRRGKGGIYDRWETSEGLCARLP